MGRVRRRTGLDEPPNIIKVIKVDMNLMGPRPEPPEMSQGCEPWHLRKWDIKPDVTGLVQVCGRSILKFQAAIAYDWRYVDEHCFGPYMPILARTVAAIARGGGAF